MAKPISKERAAFADLRDEVWDEIAKARNISVRKVSADAKRVRYKVSIDLELSRAVLTSTIEQWAKMGLNLFFKDVDDDDANDDRATSNGTSLPVSIV
jgi:hypothetical protein